MLEYSKTAIEENIKNLLFRAGHTNDLDYMKRLMFSIRNDLLLLKELVYISTKDYYKIFECFSETEERLKKEINERKSKIWYKKYWG